MRILLIGASGFIGKNFILKAPRDWEITAIYRISADFPRFASVFPNLSIIKCNLSDSFEAKNKLSALVRSFDIGVFVWGNSDIGYSCREPIGDLNANVSSLINLVSNLCFGKFIFMSSGTVYMGQKGLVDGNKFLVPTSPYGISKLSSELYVRFFAQETDRIKEYVNIRFFGAYGPMEPSRKIFTNLIRRLYIEKKSDFTLSGDGTNLIDAMYIDDTIDALQKIILSNKSNLTLDLCRGEPMSIKELVLRVSGILGLKDLQLKYSGETKERITFYTSPKKAEELFGFKARISLEEGIKRFKDYLVKEESYV